MVLIQVSYSIEDERTRKREITALEAAVNELATDKPIQCILLTMDKNERIELNGISIQVRNIIDWLLFP